MDAFVNALPLAFGASSILANIFGVVVGLVFGAIPGLTFSMALALVLPLTFGLAPMSAIGLLIGTYIGGMSGGTISAILIGVPGTPSAAATVIDGYQMRLNGKASLALSLSVIVSVYGGLFSLAVMVVSVDLIARLAIRFGPAEIFALVVFGMSTICGLAEKSLLRGLIAGTIGLMVMTIGLDDISGAQRLTFGTVTLQQGINPVVAMIGLFAVPHVITTIMTYLAGEQRNAKPDDVKVELPPLRMLWNNLGLMTRSAGIGTVIGAIPGTGGPIASFLAYDHARRFAKDKSRFGKGAEEGVIAPETANNAVTGGAMIPLLSLGIPGDPATAVMLSGLLIHGLIPGPMLFREHPTEIYAIYLAVFIANIAVVAIQLYGVRIFVKALIIPPHMLAVAIILMCVIGSYALRNSVFDVYTMAIIGLIGYLLVRVRIPLTPIILGLVLGPTLEREYRTAIILSEGNYDIFYTSWPAMGFFALSALVLAMHVRSTLRERRLARAAAMGQK
ncbi:MAG: tripartite tricarboxylate transporter permease [Proteobacteria bacterium]|nr:tripartite tricarboxylate transporter permease [Pseudomonadota bacterium]